MRRLVPRLAIGNAPLLPELAQPLSCDVLHLHHPFIFGTELHLLARLRARRAAPPLVVSYHNQLIGEGLRRPAFAGWEASWGRALVRAASRVLVVSHAHAATVPNLRRAADKLIELPNGVDVDRFAAAAPDRRRELRARLGLAEDEIVCAFVATLDRAHFLKRPDLALEAFARAADTDARLRLIVVGGGEWLEDLRQRATALGLQDRVGWLGAVDHERLPEVLQASDLMLVSSDRESFGIVLLEAMACELPTVSTDPPGVRAVVRDGATGLLASVGNAPALAAAIVRLAADATLRASMGAAGRALSVSRYGWDGVVDRLESVYAEVLKR